MWNLPAPPGFQGLRDDLSLTRYQRRLPHWRQSGATYFVTFRLADSLPASRLHELAAIREEWELRHPPPQSEEACDLLAREMWEKTERWLDAGHGSCALRNTESASCVGDAMRHFDGPIDPAAAIPQSAGPCTPAPSVESRYQLGAFVVMPNHVHALVRPTASERWPLEEIVGGWKRFSAYEIQKRLNVTGMFWQEEAFDRLIRDEEQLWRTLQYIGRNPAQAGLAAGEAVRWVRPSWEACGWAFESGDPPP